MAILFSPDTTIVNIERAQKLLGNLTEEAYRFFPTPKRAMLRPAGSQPKNYTSEFAHDDASELQKLLMESEDVRALVSAAETVGYSLHLQGVKDDGQIIFSKEKLGVTYGGGEQVSAWLCGVAV